MTAFAVVGAFAAVAFIALLGFLVTGYIVIQFSVYASRTVRRWFRIRREAREAAASLTDEKVAQWLS